MLLTIDQKRNPATGKPITVITGIKHNPQVIEKLESKLKSACGTGGYIDGKTIVLQGSHRERAVKILVKEGFEIKNP